MLLPTPEDIAGAALVELIRQRPKSFQHVNYGRGAYSNVLKGTAAQAVLAIIRLLDGVKGSSLLAEGDQLKAYIASEYALPPSLLPTKSIGTAVLDRSASIAVKPAGVIKAGFKFRRDAEPTATVPILAAEYETTADVPVAANQDLVVLPIRAVKEGSASNTPSFSVSPYKTLSYTNAPFDKHFTPTAYDAGGGSDGILDDDLRRFARAYSAGQYGSSEGAMVVAALAASGVQHYLLDDASSTIYVADKSWGSSGRWISSVAQQIVDSEFTGYATLINVQPIPNTIVSVSLTIRLRDTSYLSDTSEIDAAVSSALSAYFNERVDFNVCSVQALRGAVTRAHPRILHCTAATIMPLPSQPFFGHLYLPGGASTNTYLGPV